MPRASTAPMISSGTTSRAADGPMRRHPMHNNAPAVGYSTVYPVSMFLRILTAQLLILIGCGPPGLHLFARISYYFQIDVPWSFRSFRELLFLHINNTMAILLKTASVRVSSIQIMQVRVQNKGESVWKSRYDGDVSRGLGLHRVGYKGGDLHI